MLTPTRASQHPFASIWLMCRSDTIQEARLSDGIGGETRPRFARLTDSVIL